MSPELEIVMKAIAALGPGGIAVIVWWELRKLREQIHADTIDLIEALGSFRETQAALKTTIEGYDRRRRPVRDTREDP